MKIFLDDIRQPKECLSYMYHRIGPLNPIYNEDWFVVKNYDQFLNVICHNADVITHVSFDHDLVNIINQKCIMVKRYIISFILLLKKKLD